MPMLRHRACMVVSLRRGWMRSKHRRWTWLGHHGAHRHRHCRPKTWSRVEMRGKESMAKVDDVLRSLKTLSVDGTQSPYGESQVQGCALLSKEGSLNVHESTPQHRATSSASGIPPSCQRDCSGTSDEAWCEGERVPGAARACMSIGYQVGSLAGTRLYRACLLLVSDYETAE